MLIAVGFIDTDHGLELAEGIAEQLGDGWHAQVWKPDPDDGQRSHVLLARGEHERVLLHHAISSHAPATSPARRARAFPSAQSGSCSRPDGGPRWSAWAHALPAPPLSSALK